MQCPRCSRDVPPHSAFCLHCGAAVDSTLYGSPAPKSSVLVPVLLGVAIVVLLAILGVGSVLLYKVTQPPDQSAHSNTQNTNVQPSPRASIISPAPVSAPNSTPPPVHTVPIQNTNVAPEPPTISEPNRVTILSDTFEVKPQQYFTSRFTVPPDGARITGRFRAISGDNIMVHILDADGYTNFEHRNPFRSYYDSGKSAVGSIDMRMVGGSYYLVFENSYSIFSKKVVQATVTMEY